MIGILLTASTVHAWLFSHELLERHQPSRCVWFDRGTHFVINTTCYQRGILPELSLEQTAEALRPYLVDVKHSYNVEDALFTYKDAELIYTDEFTDLVAYRSHDNTRQQETNQDGMILLPKSIVAYQQIANRSTFASVRDTRTYGPCRLQNYKVAMAQLDKITIAPDEYFNMNQEIARQPGYCTGGQNFLFYQWVCGWSTQLFWNGMINPFLEVTKRYAHGMRYAGFYGSNILGDDASMYERWKQLEVKNIGDKPLYMMTFERPSDNNTVLLTIYPGSHDFSTLIHKQQTGKQSAVVSSTVFDKQEAIVYSQERTSYYRWIDTSIDENAPIYQ